MDKKNIILMVEDEKSVMDVNRRMLKRRGYDLKEASNAKEAYQFLNTATPDLLILDIMLPDGNGYDICKYFRKYSNNPVIFLTGKTDTKDKIEGLSDGCDYYMTKPYNFDELLAVVNRMLIRAETENLNDKRTNNIKIGNLLVDIYNSKAYIDGEDKHLTETEFAILKIFIENRNNILSADDIYKLVWNNDSNGDTRNIRKHIMNIRNKISADDSNYYDIANSYGKGYSFITEEKEVKINA